MSMCLNVCSVCFIQVMNHAAAAQSASLIFICVHREHYEFLETLAPHLEGKVNQGLMLESGTQNPE